MSEIQKTEINGAEILDEKEKSVLNKLINENYPKLKRKIKNMDSLKIYIKEHNKEGTRKKYSVEMTITGPVFIKASAFDWDFARTLHKVLKKLETEIEHKFHVSEQR